MVLCTFDIFKDYYLPDVWGFEYFGSIVKRRSRMIFVEMYLRNNTIGAEHRNI
jgi:hypothetical protein